MLQVTVMEVVGDPTPESVLPQWSTLLEDTRAGGGCLGAFLPLRKAQRTRTLRRSMGRKLHRGSQRPRIQRKESQGRRF